MCDRLYFPMFPLRVGLLTLYVDGFSDDSSKAVSLPAYYTEVFH